MALKIVRKDEPIEVNQIVVCLYSNPGIGKSTLGFSAETPILLDFDQGCYRAKNRGDSVQIESWSDVIDITAEDLAPFKTVVIDTAGRALDLLTVDIISKNAKMGRGGALTLQGYGELKAKFTAWLKNLNLIGKDVVLIAHSSEDKKGDELIERLDVQGGSKGEIYKSADAMGRLSVVNGKRVLNFSPTDTAFGKNPAQFDPIMVPEIDLEPQFLGGLIAEIKSRLNALTQSQTERQSRIADWLCSFDDAKTAQDYNDLVVNVKSADKSILPVVKAALHKKATDAGMIYDKAKGYVEAA